MDDSSIEIFHSNIEDIEQYLSESILSYGVDQLNGEKPVKLYCCSKNDKGNRVGGAMGYVTRNLFFITHLFVEQKYRNKGIGKALLLTIEKAAKEQGCTVLRLNTLNNGAHSLYTKAGFDITTTIENYMNGFDLVYFHKSIK